MSAKVVKMKLRIVTLLLLSLSLFLLTTSAQAVPSFARQTSLPCHTVYPELTPFGRSFKLHGYIMTNIK